MSGQKLSQFWVADFSSGSPEIGDPVYMRRISSDDSEAPAVNP
ncbi:hypothetical protein [Rubritalea marina]|nr:hypothetical protein [Rubritalea marina]